MRILHVNYYDTQGGAAKAAYRLHRGLLDAGHESIMLVAEKKSDDDSVITAFSPWQLRCLRIKQRIESFICRLPRRKHNYVHALNLFSSNLPEIINAKKADIVNLHWVNGCMLSIEDFKKIKFPVIWTLHDAWAYCGAEHHHKRNDDAFKSAYQGMFSVNKWTWRRKCIAWANLPFRVVVPSRWLCEEASNSFLFKNRDINLIPNGIDLKVFTPKNKLEIRQKLGISKDKMLIAFGAFDVNDNNKGGTELLAALNLIHEKYRDNIELLIIGNGKINLPLKSHNIGFVTDESEMAELYSAADVFLLASKMESFGNMLAEASACGVACVAFSTGGITDIIQHRQTGYLAECFSPQDLAVGLEYVLANIDELGSQAAEYCRENFAVEKVANKYIKLYEKIINE